MRKMNPLWCLVLVVAVLGSAHLGTELFSSSAAEAQARQSYSVCFHARQESVDVNDEGLVEEPARNRLIRIPRGWTVVSGSGGSNRPTILLCR